MDTERFKLDATRGIALGHVKKAFAAFVLRDVLVLGMLSCNWVLPGMREIIALPAAFHRCLFSWRVCVGLCYCVSSCSSSGCCVSDMTT